MPISGWLFNNLWHIHWVGHHRAVKKEQGRSVSVDTGLLSNTVREKTVHRMLTSV